MSNPISRPVWERIQQLVTENPNISTREIARKLNIGRDAAEKWRNRRVYTDDLPVIEKHRLQHENNNLRQQVKDLLVERATENKMAEFANTLASTRVVIPKWISQRRVSGKDSATVCAMLSDWHLDEVVVASQVGGCNEFNRNVALTRCGQFFDHTAGLAKKYINGISYNGLYLLLGGDLFSGNIHEELRETNESTLIESVLFWTPHIASGISYLADQFNHVHIPCVVGNHGRNTRKPIAKNRVQDNFDWLFYHMLAMQLKNDKRITWDISQSADCQFKIYDTSFMFTHGDQFRGGSGISGPAVPWALGDHRKRKRMQGIGTPYDILCFGHWHQLTLGMNGIICNGALKGMDEWAYIMNFPYEPPQQALWLVQPKVGITGRWPIHVLGDAEKFR